MNESESIATRLKLLVDEAGSQKAVARCAQVSDGTLINWVRGLGIRESKVREVAHNLGVSLRWLREGVGDDDAELAAFRARLRPAVGGPRAALRRARERAGLSVADLARLTGYPSAMLEQLEDGAIHASEKMIEAICRHVPGLEPPDLQAGSEHVRTLSEDGMEATYGAKPQLKLPPGMTGRYVPLLSQAQAGAWDADHSDALYDHTAMFAPNVDDRRAFAIKVSGNSMEPELREGDFVICSPSQALHNGEAAVVRTRSDQVFIKYWRRQGERVVLESANAAYKPIEFPLTEIEGAWPIVQHIASGKIKKQLP